MRHVLTLLELSAAEIDRIFIIAEDLKAKFEKGLREPILPGRVMALLFEKPSLRTRVSFESCMAHLGGATQFLGADVGWGKRESIADFAGVLGQYVDVIVCRANRHSRVEELARHAQCPVINGLTDEAHPCQALADLFTLREVCGALPGRKLAYVGDANNVARSLAVACAKLSVRLSLASPEGYALDAGFLAEILRDSPQAEIELTDDPAEAVQKADGVYTDVWTSMGQEAEEDERRRVFAPYQVNAALMSRVPRTAVFLHCLPARRGEEVTDDVIDGPQSRVLQQAANRLHAQKGLLAWLLGSQG
ncbi:MAG: ornithine carbamoyltransferase [Planctomycetes bacterium]|nr:ornithine carbamoyltransferase [Planctomycetota bacterium]